MEPIDTDFDYVARRSRENPRARFNWLYILPTLGVLWVIYLVIAVIFQLPANGVVSPVMTLMILFFFCMVGMLFWAMAPKANRE